MHRTGQSGNRRKTMADISAEIKKFKDAVYGKDVRGSMISLAEKVNAETEKTTKLAQDTDKKAEGFNQRIEDNKNAVAKLRNDHNTDIIALTQSKADAIINTATGEHIAVGDSSGHLLDNLKIYGKSVQNGTPTPDNPVPIVSTGDEENIEIEVTGKNLIPFPYPMLGGVGTTKTLYGVTATVLEDRGIRITGTASDMVYINIVEDAGLIKDGLIYSIDLRNGKPNNNLIFYFVSKGTTVNKVYYPQIEYGEKATDYEPFQPLQSLSIPTANGLLGIPTESGGNYTDQKGQQWICDSIDLGRGKYVHRVKKLVLNGSENFIFDKINDYGIANFFIKLPIKSKARKSFCSHLPNKDISIANATDEGFTIVINEGIFLRFNSTRINTVEALKAWLKENPVTIIYMNEPPTESDIPAEVFEAYKKLYSNYPSTVIQNYSGTDMELSYVADTQNYTDNKIKEAVSAQTQNLANLLSLMPLSTQAAMIEADTNNILDNMEVTEHE